jgi:hypothetical protein
MNNRLLKILTVLLITAITLPTIPVFAGIDDYPASNMWMQPDTLTGPAGTIFEILVWVNVSVDGFTYEVKITWDNTILSLLSFTHTNGDPDGKDWLDQRTGGSSVLTGPIISADEANLGGSCLGSDYVPAYTAGKLARARFEVIGAPEKYGSLDTYITFITGSSYILDTGLNTAALTHHDAHYHYDWVLPPSPHLAIDPDLVEYTQYVNATGEEFDVDLMIMDLEADWSLHNVTCTVAFNDTILTLVSVTFDALWGSNSWGIVPGATITLFAGAPTSTPFGDVLIATLRFRVLLQGENPPDSDPLISPLDIEGEILWDTIETIPTEPEIDGLVRIFPLLALPLPYIEVSNVTMGPGPARGAHFNVTVDIKNLHFAWNLLGAEFRLTYPTDLIAPVQCYEGPFFPYWAAQQPGSLGSWWTCFLEPGNADPPHVLWGGLILPNATGWWHPPAPGGPDESDPLTEGTIAIIEFEVLYQSFGDPDLTGDLDIIWNLAVGIDNFDDQNIVDVPLDHPINGTYWITTDWPGRVIDLYGGAINRGYGSLPFPEPYGGQGPHNPMDLVIPQAEVHLFAYVSYNYWPVQNKLVGFEVEGPEGILLKRTAATDCDGYATIAFEMPWRCDDPEAMFGLWTVTATVDISDTRINDTMVFKYDYMVRIWKVTTDMFEYNHCDEVVVTIEYGTYAQQWYPALFSVLLMDELIVPVGMALVETEIGGAEWCRYANGTITVSIHIPKWAFAGLATIHVNAYDRDPTEGGVAWTPEFEPPPVIAIQPY